MATPPAASSTTASTPIIPMIRLDDPDEPTVVQTLRNCCMEHGFFYLGGHGLEKYFPRVLQESAKLFALPTEEKQNLYDPHMSRGYTSMEEETLDPANQTRGDTKEGFYIGNEIAPDNPLYNPSKLRGPNIWPTNDNSSLTDPDTFHQVMNDYYRQASAVGLQVVQLLSQAIGVDKHKWDDCFQTNFASLRLLHYAAVPSRPQEGVFACGAHSDYGMITLLMTDENPGLQILYKGNWMDVPPKSLDEGLLVVNLGDMLERWTNGLFQSTLHRVLTAGNKERYSVPFFYEPDFDTKVECLGCSPENPPKYPPTTSGHHLLEKYNKTHKDFRPEET